MAASLPLNDTQKHLIVISDLYEHSSLFSLYNTTLVEALDQNEQQILSKMPDLRGVQVYLKMIDRPELSQDASFIEGWLEFFRRAGATLRTHSTGPEDNAVTLEIAERITG